MAKIAIECDASYAQKRQVIIGTTRFLCCTLWTDFAINGDVVAGLAEARSRMNDYKYIRMAESKYRKIRPEGVAASEVVLLFRTGLRLG